MKRIISILTASIWPMAVIGLLALLCLGWVLQGDSEKMRFGATGTYLTEVEIHNLAFAGDTVTTATTAVSAASYAIAGGWKSTSADPGKWTASISGTTIAGTAATVTTGTLSLIVIELAE